LSTSFLTIGMASRLVGNPTTKPITNPPRNLSKKPDVNPVIIAVMVNVIEKDMANVINMADSTVEYFLLILMKIATYVCSRICDETLSLC